jgi:hypothetical protein
VIRALGQAALNALAAVIAWELWNRHLGRRTERFLEDLDRKYAS